MPLPSDWRMRLARYERQTLDSEKVVRRAATAVLLIEPAAGIPELLFMLRAKRAGDPWSGQVAFPGGHVDPGDADLAATARREAEEELGVTLRDVLGALDDRPVHTGPHTVVTPFVFATGERPELRPDPREAAGGLFVSLSTLLDPANHSVHTIDRGDHRLRYPAIALEQRAVLWGLTYRTVVNFAQIIGHTLPE